MKDEVQSGIRHTWPWYGLLQALVLALALWMGLTGAFRWRPESAAAQGNAGTYTVVAGDTLAGIAERFGVSLESLIQLNGIQNPDLIQVGQVLLIPGGGEGTAAVDLAVVYARPGESLRAVALRYGQDAAVLATLNGQEEHTSLFPGQPVLVPRETLPPSPLRFGAVATMSLPDALVQGRTGRLWVTTRRPLSLTATWNGLPVVFTPTDADPLRQFALLPVPALLAPQPYPLIITYQARNGFPLSRTWQIPVVAGDYETQDIVLPPDRGELLEPTLVQAELEKVTAVWSQVSPTLLWRDVFSRPVSLEYVTSSPFGTRRSYNSGPVASYHAGQDFAAPEGVPVVAPGDGVVALAEPLDVRGNAVLLDHGRGIFTGYWHLSQIDVTPGQMVRQGDLLGLVGNSGLSTGAHLHWELRIYGVAVDPMQFVEEPLAGLSP
ncbi:LysM peptidoglycan-binding domain-containing M23 family metallopeptidase [Litorilinea aerophila]|uniref:Peptidoglycan DD-metalloendopeptidase family protein n=1 Tax=Litorilinea aerophila TaxID=1204385 RepID=A0A540VAP3_9CHLR|nr:peptidoglycan DD-metalloendopeptidase family protein [Litorilinea aerophila]MCC9078297.1 LysM peptidoglycan-binding domain-containing M23 family metallopeptidase [Litorilinea aerophila]GIV77158.1 MAG: hypothetical protein KatS3mg050_1552 [Litorilinea sp.]